MSTITSSEIHWSRGLKNFLLKEIIPLTTEDEEIRKKLVSDEAMKIWKVAFTHETFDPNYGKNYEVLELFGDKVIALDFTLYLMNAFENITVKELSELKNFYLSKEELARISSKYKLADWVRSPIQKNIDVREDIFESLFGALYIIGDKVIKYGAGNILCQSLLFEIFEREEIDIERVSRGKPKTQVIEMFKKAGWGQIISEWNEEKKILTLKLPKFAVEDLKKKKIKLGEGEIFVVAEGNTKKSAEEAAYKKALNKLEELGLDREWFERRKVQRELESAEIIDFLPELEGKSKKEGYEYVYFSKPRVKEKEVFIQLIGVKSDGKKVILVTKSGKDISEAKRNVVKGYVYGL
jgi:dsRNA-specific ribonuclease